MPSQRLIINSGKGGVGKTTLSAAMALACAGRAERVLLVEIDADDSSVGRLFGHPAPGPRPVQLETGIWGVNLRPLEAARDFLKEQLKLKLLTNRVLKSEVFRSFVETAPAIPQLLCLGALYKEVHRLEPGGERYRYDTIIVDAPATGHGLSLLNVPQNASRALFGPLRRYAELMRDLFHDPAATVLNVITLPEEMPVGEALDMVRLARADRLPLGHLILNAAEASPTPLASRLEAVRTQLVRVAGQGGTQALLEAARLKDARAEQTQHYVRALEEASLPLVVLPRHPAPELGSQELADLATRLGNGLWPTPGGGP